MQFFVGLASLECVVSAIGVEKHANRVGGKFLRSTHIFGRFCPVMKIVHLQFDDVPVGIGVVHRDSKAVIEADRGFILPILSEARSLLSVPALLPFCSTKPNLVAITALSRLPARHRPSSRSFVKGP
jgi:hypothetical protein